MSKFAELMAAKRRAQIKRLEGEPDQAAESAADEALASVVPPKQATAKKPPEQRLHFTQHAHQRMAQRNVLPCAGAHMTCHVIQRASRDHVQDVHVHRS